MLQYSENMDISTTILTERDIVDSYKTYEKDMKEILETYITEFNNVSFDNDALKVMLLNNFDNAIMQIENNLQDVESLYNILDILEYQTDITEDDMQTYNNLALKVTKDMGLTQNFLQKTVSCFDSIHLSGDSNSISILEKCKDNIMQPFPFAVKPKEEEKKITLAEKMASMSIQKDIDYTNSDLLCFFPKTPKENLVISTIQDSYKISFRNTTASISIKDEDFNLSLNTPGVQISSSNSNNILFVMYDGSKYTVLTNNEIETSPAVKVSKISRNEDFLEVVVSSNKLYLCIENNIVSFQELKDEVENELEEKDEQENSHERTLSKRRQNREQKLKEQEDKTETLRMVEPEPVATPSQVEIRPTQVKEVATPVYQEIPMNAEEKKPITDNNTLVISDSNKMVTLPYKVIELEEKLKKNKNYKTLEDVINKEYTIPIETFKNPVKSRFREAFQLIKKKEHGSLKEAIGLGFELMFQSDLNPAVIAACKDLDELDIYLDCLDDNELDKFSCFKIEYNVPPSK